MLQLYFIFKIPKSKFL